MVGLALPRASAFSFARPRVCYEKILTLSRNSEGLNRETTGEKAVILQRKPKNNACYFRRKINYQNDTCRGFPTTSSTKKDLT